jgi:hypothetical protein
MNGLRNKIFLALSLAIACAGVGYAQTSDNNGPLNNAAVVKLVRAGFKEKTIVSIIGSRPAAYDLSPERMIELKHDGVSEKIILAMLDRQQGMYPGDDSWGNDPFFRSSSDKTKDNQKSGTQNQTDIFGSSGSGEASTKTKSGSMSQAGDTVTTGSATVRIIRPPTETSNAPIKLDRAPSLTNDSIIELVEAGFSEGTIVRRIEQSPVDFDLSQAKIADLRKHRVGERILNAMKAAMGNDSNGNKSTAPSNGTPKQ